MYCNSLQIACALQSANPGSLRSAKGKLSSNSSVAKQMLTLALTWVLPRMSGLVPAKNLMREQIVKLLLDAGADVNAEGGYYSGALQAASY